jgi:hypothetical protein
MVELVSKKEIINLKFSVPFAFLAFILTNLFALIPISKLFLTTSILAVLLLHSLLNMILYVLIQIFCLKNARSKDTNYEKYSISLYYYVLYLIFNTILLSILNKGFKLSVPGIFLIFVTLIVPLFFKDGSSRVSF